MCKDLEPSDLVARCTQLADATVVGLRFSPDHAARAKIPPVRFHFVLDNSGSMGNNSLVAKERFADLASVATLGVSLVSFDSSAQLLGTAFTTPQQLRDVKLPRQGGTNITAGIQSSLAVIRKFAAEEDAHHLLVLLSDGQHMTGPAPRAALPQMGAELKKDFPQLRLSVVVVGVTRSSDTSLGMLLKETLETAPLPDLQPIYFADSPQQMTTTLEQMHVGLTSLQGAMVTVSLSEGCFIRAGQDGEKTTQVLANEREQVLLCQGAVPNITVDGKLYEVEVEPFNASLITKALDDQLAAARIRRIASGAESVRPAVKQLGAWIRVLEKAAAPEKLNLAKASAKERLAQHRSLVAAAHGFRALRNQLAELDAYAANDSASQAAFLTGASRKYGAKALRRANDNEVNPEQRRRELIAEAKQLQPRMRRALLEDLCSKLCCDEALQRALPTGAVPEEVMRKICAGELPAEVDESLAEFLEGPVLQKVTANCRRSYVSLQTAMEQLHEWVDFNGLDSCDTEYELLMCLGTVGYPIDVKRRDATQMNPYAMDVTRLRPSAVDTASVCTAQHSEQPVVPVEGGAAIEDVLVLVDPDAPKASKLAVNSLLLRETYTSVVLSRDLHMFTGNSMRLALHAHALLATAQPPRARTKDDLEQQLRRQFLGRAYQCPSCGYGPIDHYNCGDLEEHHGEDDDGARVNNSCPSCQWFSPDIQDWDSWDGTVPPAALGNREEGDLGAFATAASLEVFLRIVYSARKLWKTDADSDLHKLCEKMAKWESLTAADGVDHPVQLLLALAAVDELPEAALDQVPLLLLLNEALARSARDELKSQGCREEPQIIAAARKRVASFLGISASSAPAAQELMTAEPPRSNVREACNAEYTLETKDFDYKTWVTARAVPWAHALCAVQQLRKLVAARGWAALEKAMERGQALELVAAMQFETEAAELLKTWLDVERPCEEDRVLATMAAQAFLHQSSRSRRTVDNGGCLTEILPDVRHGNTLRELAVDVRMAIYDERVEAKSQEWASVGAGMSFELGHAADVDGFKALCWRASHVHGLDKATFWGLWRAAKRDREKAQVFVRSANEGFVEKHCGNLR
ncbi:unnamed protein product [Effrenium voratum]|nr:unnamed protein product [Effrenium voratum]